MTSCRPIHRHSVSLLLSSASTPAREEGPARSTGNENRQNTASEITTRPARRFKTLNSVKKLPYFGLYQYRSTITSARWRPTISNTEKGNEDDDIVTEHKFIPAPWLKLNILSFQAAKSCGVWKYSFRPIRVVPYDYPLFEACRYGTVGDIISILSQGTASLHDVDEAGRNALIVSLMTLYLCPSPSIPL